MTVLARKVTASRPFHAAIITVILGSGVLAGLETDAALVARHGDLLQALDAAVLAIFVLEIALKIAAHGRRPFAYFREGWNVFDFTIVALCLLPFGGPFGAVLRLVRILRLLRLITARPHDQAEPFHRRNHEQHVGNAHRVGGTKTACPGRRPGRRRGAGSRNCRAALPPCGPAREAASNVLLKKSRHPPSFCVQPHHTRNRGRNLNSPDLAAWIPALFAEGKNLAHDDTNQITEQIQQRRNADFSTLLSKVP